MPRTRMRIDFQPRPIFSGNCGSGKGKMIKIVPHTADKIPRGFDNRSMLSIIGILIVFGAVVAGYLMEHGKLLVLAQPAELIIIFGAAAGTVVTANPLPTLIRLGKAMAGVLSSSPYTKAFYTEKLKMLAVGSLAATHWRALGRQQIPLGR